MKQKSAKIYDSETAFFTKSFDNVASTSKSDNKPVTLIDLERQVITEKGGEFEELADKTLAEKQKQAAWKNLICLGKITEKSKPRCKYRRMKDI